MDAQCFVQAGDIGGEIPVFDDLETFVSHPAAQIAIRAQGQKVIGESVNVARFDDKPVFPVADEVPRGPYLGGCDNGAACVHRFVGHEAPGFGIGGQYKDVTDIVKGRQFRLCTEAQKMNRIRRGIRREGFQFVAQLPVAGNQEVGASCRGVVNNLLKCPDQILGPFSGLKFRGEQNNRTPRFKSQLGAECFAFFRRIGDAFCKLVVVHGVGHPEQLILPEAYRGVVFPIPGADCQNTVKHKSHGLMEKHFYQAPQAG